MSTVEEIEEAVSRLSREKLARFRAWFEKFDAGEFDRRIERDAADGKLDRLAEEALEDLREGRARKL